MGERRHELPLGFYLITVWDDPTRLLRLEWHCTEVLPFEEWVDDGLDADEPIVSWDELCRDEKHASEVAQEAATRMRRILTGQRSCRDVRK